MCDERGATKLVCIFTACVVIVVGVLVLWRFGGDDPEVASNEAMAQVLVYRDAYVHEVNVGVSNGGVAVVAHGILSDACTKVNDIMQDRDGKQFYITILSARPEGTICSQMIVPFEEVIPLENAMALAPGIYSVDVNGISKNFSVQ